MKRATSALAILALATASLALAADEAARVKSLRGDVPIDQTPPADIFRQEKDHAPVPRDFVQMPPLIPHAITNYQVTKNFNKCMDCHAWSKYKETGATKVSLTHFKDREGTELQNISPRRYFCTQCHVPQTDARPLVENTYRRAEALREAPAK